MVRESTREDVAGLAIECGLVEKMRHSYCIDRLSGFPSELLQLSLPTSLNNDW